MTVKQLFKPFLALVLAIAMQSQASRLDSAARFVPILTQTQINKVYNDNVAAIKTVLSNNNIDNPEEVANLIYKLHIAYRSEGITAKVILGMIETESNFKPKAVCRPLNGGAVSYGLMQVTPKTAEPILKVLGIKTATKAALFKPIVNIYVGTIILRYNILILKNRGISPKNRLDYALGIYNLGEGNFFRTMHGKVLGKTAKTYILLQHKNQTHWGSIVN